MVADRLRKVWITNSGTWRRERIYLGGFEIWRKYTLVSGNWVLDDERETVHISDDHRRICMVESLTWDDGTEIADQDVVPRRRFQFDNHLGTACVETDETGAVISYEEFHPYGTSSYRSWDSNAEVSAKRYRYTGKERDEETSLAYHGARYYAPWLGRWMSADPAGTVDGTNLFAYVRGSPVVLSDPSGTQSTPEPPSLELQPEFESFRPQVVGSVPSSQLPRLELKTPELKTGFKPAEERLTEAVSPSLEKPPPFAPSVAPPPERLHPLVESALGKLEADIAKYGKGNFPDDYFDEFSRHIFEGALELAGGDYDEAFTLLRDFAEDEFGSQWHAIDKAVGGKHSTTFDKVKHFSWSAWAQNVSSGFVLPEVLEYGKEALDEVKHWIGKHDLGWDDQDVDADIRGENFAEEMAQRRAGETPTPSEPPARGELQRRRQQQQREARRALVDQDIGSVFRAIGRFIRQGR